MESVTTDLIIKIVSALIALSGLIYAWLKDLQLKRKTYADKIRSSAGEIIAKLERRKSIMLSLYHEIQPLITDTDILFTETKDKIKTRDKFWKDIIIVCNSIKSKILDEKIEIAYVNLMGYQPSIMRLYQERIELLMKIDDEMRTTSLNKTQDIILNQDIKKVEPATLGNLLRGEIFLENEDFKKQIDSAIFDIINHLTELIRKDDNAIYAKK